MNIQQMFKNDINRNINGVVQVDQDTEQILVQELKEYVITKELKKHLFILILMMKKQCFLQVENYLIARFKQQDFLINLKKRALLKVMKI